MRAVLIVLLVSLIAYLLSRKSATAALAPALSGGQNPLLIQDIKDVAQAEGVPAASLYAIAATEQGTGQSAEWNSNAVNLSDPYGGAWGLTQVLAGTAASLGIEVPQELMNPVAALTATAKYLRKYSSNVDNIAEDAQVYNAGPNAGFTDTAYIQKALTYAHEWPNVAGSAA